MEGREEERDEQLHDTERIGTLTAADLVVVPNGLLATCYKKHGHPNGR